MKMKIIILIIKKIKLMKNHKKQIMNKALIKVKKNKKKIRKNKIKRKIQVKMKKKNKLIQMK